MNDKLNIKHSNYGDESEEVITLLALVRDLLWPEGAVCVVQDRFGLVTWLPSMPCASCRYGGSSTFPDDDGDWWWRADGLGRITCDERYSADFRYAPLTSDWNTAVITKGEWESVQ